MKIGILTHHQVHNEGAILQAYAQSQNLKHLGGEEIVDYRFKQTEDFQKRVEPPARYELFENFINTKLPLSKYRLVSDNYEEAIEFVSEYDALVVGSDEVWKTEAGGYSKPFPNIYWLHPKLKAKKIALAASANRLVYGKLDSTTLSKMRSLLKEFDLLGVRDQHTLNLLKSFGLEGIKVPDPTILFDFPDIDLRDRLIKKGVNFKKPLLGLRINKKADRKHKGLAKFIPRAKKTHQVIAVSYHSKYADIYLDDLNPFEWASVFKYFNHFVTVSYHGLIFSLKNNIPVAVIDVDKRYKTTQSKGKDLLTDLNLMSLHGLDNSLLKINSVKYDLSLLEERQNLALAKLKEVLLDD